MLPFLFLGLYHARTKILHQTLLTNNSPSLWLDTGDHKTEWKKWIIGSNVTEIYNCDISISKGEKVFAKMKKKICFNVQFANGRCKINFLVELVHNANCIILYIFPLFFSFFSSFFFVLRVLMVLNSYPFQWNLQHCRNSNCKRTCEITPENEMSEEVGCLTHS